MSDGNVAADQLRLLIERIERLEEEKKGVADDIKDVYAEAKATGFDTKTMRKVVSLRKMEKHHPKIEEKRKMFGSEERNDAKNLASALVVFK